MKDSKARNFCGSAKEDVQKPGGKLVNYVSIELPLEHGAKTPRQGSSASAARYTSYTDRPQTCKLFPIIHSSPLYKATVRSSGLSKSPGKQGITENDMVKDMKLLKSPGSNESYRVFNSKKETKKNFSPAFHGKFEAVSSLSVRSLKCNNTITSNSPKNDGEWSYKKEFMKAGSSRSSKRINEFLGSKISLRLKQNTIEFVENEEKKKVKKDKIRKISKKNLNLKPLQLLSNPEDRIGVKAKGLLTINSITRFFS